MKNYLDMYKRYFLLFTALMLAGLGSTQAQVAEQDSLALVAFYHATDGPNWTSSQDGFGIDDLTSEWQGVYDGGYSKWLEGPVKDWFGVKVEKRLIPNTSDSANRVTWVWPVVGRRDDGQNFLEGYVPREMAYLTALERFQICGNTRMEWAELPDDIYHESLNYLDIEYCYLGGDISDAFRNCIGIKKMNFRYNHINYMPVLDFLSSEALYALDGVQWYYSTQIPFSIFEKTIDYFYTISSTPKEFPIEARDIYDVGDESEIVAALGSAVDLECVYAGDHEDQITYQWYKNGSSMFGKTSRTVSISSVAESDYADYTVKIMNEYVKEYDDAGNYGEVFTKPISLVGTPVAPEVEWAQTSYNGKELRLRMTKPMPVSPVGFDGFTVHSTSGDLTITAARSEGRRKIDMVLTLSEAVSPSDVISLDYNGSSLLDKNGGILAAFADTSVTNMVREAPGLVSAVTTKDGSGIRVVFDGFIDEASINPADFTVTRSGNANIASATLAKGEIDEHISKVVLLTLEEPITDSTEVLQVRYTKGELCGFLSGVVESSADVEAENEISLDLTEVLLTMVDGSGQLESVVIDASWRVTPLEMFDDGSHGDETAGDHVWTLAVNLVDENYTWDVMSRTSYTDYDTTMVEDPETGVITLTVTPFVVNNDSLLSESVLMEFTVFEDVVSGITSFGINNIPVTFNLTVQEESTEIFLMGIDDDWGLGIPMDQLESSLVYTTEVPGYTQGDVIHYNYRIGDDWENISIEPRSYTVVPGENIVSDVFGDFGTTIKRKEAASMPLVYPNPFCDMLSFSGVENFSSAEIYDITGHLVKEIDIQSVSENTYNLSSLKKGSYLITFKSLYKANYTLLILKN